MNLASNHSRRGFLKRSLAFSMALCGGQPQSSAFEKPIDDWRRDRIAGLLYGSLIGDATGGPVEFKPPQETKHLLADVRGWDDQRTINETEIEALAQTFPLLGYQKLRPKAEPFGQWRDDAVAGTVTDDTRHKVVLLRALMKLDGERPMRRGDLATAYVEFAQSKTVADRPHYKALCAEAMAEHLKAAKWILGERHPDQAAPPARIWGGVSTCCGQMTLPPVACVFIGQPTLAYRAAYQLAFFDNGPALDINSAIVAGLATALATDERQSRSRRWKEIVGTMRESDPYRYRDIPWVGRQLIQWLDTASRIVRAAEGSPKKLFALLEKDGKPRYWWDAHFIFVCVCAMFEFCNGNGLAAMHLALDFGHDTDSVAQLIGAFAGAMGGAEVFPQPMRVAVETQLINDYDESVESWADLLTRLGESQSQVISLG